MTRDCKAWQDSRHDNSSGMATVAPSQRENLWLGGRGIILPALCREFPHGKGFPRDLMALYWVPWGQKIKGVAQPWTCLCRDFCWRKVCHALQVLLINDMNINRGWCPAMQKLVLKTKGKIFLLHTKRNSIRSMLLHESGPTSYMNENIFIKWTSAGVVLMQH